MENFKIEIKRRLQQKTCCLGELHIYKENKLVFSCKTLEEDIESLEAKQDNRIPPGNYKAKWNFGSRFVKVLSDLTSFECPALVVYNDDVPADRYITVHYGNTHKDTEGCILLGEAYGKDLESIVNSRNACKEFYKILNRCHVDCIIINIENKFEE